MRALGAAGARPPETDVGRIRGEAFPAGKSIDVYCFPGSLGQPVMMGLSWAFTRNAALSRGFAPAMSDDAP
jgi:hypothetical protein